MPYSLYALVKLVEHNHASGQKQVRLAHEPVWDPAQGALTEAPSCNLNDPLLVQIPTIGLAEPVGIIHTPRELIAVYGLHAQR